ncbi:MAG: hypothetical protein Q7R41_11385 [Phycisphaerales bacterium]|nr:hypothetical protein [Phycisphaerales bacterium]
MITSINDWVAFLRSSDSTIGFPLIICGLGLMLFGWRMWKVCVVLSFGLIGAVLGAIVADQSEHQAIFAIVGGVLLAAVSFYPARQALSVIGGLIGGGVAHFYLSRLHLDAVVHWSMCGTAFVGFAGYSFLSKQRVVIFVTAFFGAVLLMSGLAAWAMSVPAFFGTMRALASYSLLVVPFLLLVPTVMSCFYQIAEVRRLQIDL